MAGASDERVQPGTELPPRQYQVSRGDLVRYAGASGDFNVIHWNERIFAFLSVPPGPPFPEELHLRKVCGVLWCYSGSEENPACLREARAFGRPLLDGVQPMPLPALQSAFDGVYPPGDQWYWRGDFVAELPDEAIERHVEHGAI
jgi:hypothetical protein